jgi:hypothetical protein
MKKNIFLLCFVYCVSSIVFPCRSAAEEPAAKNTAERDLFFSIQVEAITSKAQAQALEKNLIQKGYPAHIEEAEDNAGKTVYQVRIGKYTSRSKAEAAGRTFYKKEKKPYWVTAVQSDEAAPDSPAAIKPGRDAGAEKDPPDAGTTHEEAEEQAPVRAGRGDLGAQNGPAAVTRIYTYRGAQGNLCITNNPVKIPREQQNSVESISVFPVTFIAFNQKEKILVLEIEQREQKVKLLGVSLPSSAVVEQVAAYCEKNLKAVPLRLKYAPVRDNKKDAPIAGTIILKQGSLTNLEIIRLGLAPCAAENLPGQFRKDCTEAEEAARSSRVGIWAGTGWQ